MSLFRQHTVGHHALPSGVPVTVLVGVRSNALEGDEVSADRRVAEARPSRLSSPMVDAKTPH